MTLHQRLNKQTVTHPYSEIPLSNEKERTSDACSNMYGFSWITQYERHLTEGYITGYLAGSVGGVWDS